MSKQGRSKRHKQNTSSTESFIIGRNAVREALRASISYAQELLISSSQNSPELEEIINLAHRHSLPINNDCSPRELTALVETESHQSVALRINGRPTHSLKDFLAQWSKDRGLIVALDGVLDPHNVGAILRASECFGVDLVFWSKKRSSGITPVVTKTSVGASELVPTLAVGNLAQSLELLQKNGFWIVAADGSQEAQSLQEFEFPEKTVLVLGAEGAGVSKLLLERADFHVKIPMYGKIDSLNVSQAASVLLYQATARRE